MTMGEGEEKERIRGSVGGGGGGGCEVIAKYIGEAKSRRSKISGWLHTCEPTTRCFSLRSKINGVLQTCKPTIRCF